MTMREHVEHMDPAQPCGDGTGCGRYSGMNYGLPSSATPTAEIVRATAIARVRYVIAQANLRIAAAHDPIDVAFVPFWTDVVRHGNRALAMLEEP